MRKFTYTRAVQTKEGREEFSAVEFDSFDEAIKAVDKGIYERKLSLTPPVIPTPEQQPTSTLNPIINNQNKNETGGSQKTG